MNLIKTIAINALILVGLVWVLNFYSAWHLDGNDHDDKTRDYFDFTFPSVENAEKLKLFQTESRQVEHTYQPFEGWRLKPFNGQTINIMPNGERVVPGIPVSSTLPPIRVFGGSTVWGTGVDDAHTLPAHLQRLFPQRQVFNHGQQAFTARQNLERLITLIQNAEPLGTVIFYNGTNDLYVPCTQLQNGQNQSGTSMDNTIQSALHAAKASRLERLFGHGFVSFTAENFGAAASEGVNTSPCSTMEFATRSAAEMITIWNIARILTEKAGGQFVAVLQPVAYTDPHISTYLPELKKSVLAQTFPAFHEIVQNTLNQQPSFHDLTKSLQNKSVYYDFCHVNSTGNALLAAEIAKFVP